MSFLCCEVVCVCTLECECTSKRLVCTLADILKFIDENITVLTGSIECLLKQ